ncbi:hypothetical protein NM208_g2911 [Fusarium decemcellulare]|uniref:Uncharacterized protein n=1 Tax=Fusarium decemcellulare TaxID=57161 RepID=A0ACC1SRG0_9HYPO|nr:hypothetical protein NM208_g2911 [Fusarium decemcellulare]
MPREVAIISAEKVLSLEPEDVSLTWGTSKPHAGLRECEERIAKAAAAAAGFDHVAITSNIHPTTTRGTRRDKPHLTVRFRSSRYLRETEQIVHINVHVWSSNHRVWVQYPFTRRPTNFPYHNVHQDGNIRFHRSIPTTLARDEVAAQQQQQQQGEQEQEQPRYAVDSGRSNAQSYDTSGSRYSYNTATNPRSTDPRSGGTSSSAAQRPDGWYPDPWSQESGTTHRWYSNGQWSGHAR